MDFEAARSRVFLIASTEVAAKWLLTSMRELVRLQVAFGDELALAYFAGEGPLAGVGAHMGLEISGLRKLLEAALVGTKQDLCLILGPRYFFNEFYRMRTKKAYSKPSACHKGVPSSRQAYRRRT